MILPAEGPRRFGPELLGLAGTLQKGSVYAAAARPVIPPRPGDGPVGVVE